MEDPPLRIHPSRSDPNENHLTGLLSDPGKPIPKFTGKTHRNSQDHSRKSSKKTQALLNSKVYLKLYERQSSEININSQRSSMGGKVVTACQGGKRHRMKVLGSPGSCANPASCLRGGITPFLTFRPTHPKLCSSIRLRSAPGRQPPIRTMNPDGSAPFTVIAVLPAADWKVIM